MAEYIDKDKFCHFMFKEIAHFEETQTDTEIPISLVLQSVVNEVKKFQSEDVQPVKHGKWIDEGVEVGSHTNSIAIINVTYCSECDEQVDYRTLYCPNCGARMDGDA